MSGAEFLFTFLALILDVFKRLSTSQGWKNDSVLLLANVSSKSTLFLVKHLYSLLIRHEFFVLKLLLTRYRVYNGFVSRACERER